MTNNDDVKTACYSGDLYENAEPICHLGVFALIGYILKGVGPRGHCWWQKGQHVILVDNKTSNRMLAGNFPYGIQVRFFGRKGDRPNKFIPIGKLLMPSR